VPPHFQNEKSARQQENFVNTCSIEQFSKIFFVFLLMSLRNAAIPAPFGFDKQDKEI